MLEITATEDVDFMIEEKHITVLKKEHFLCQK